jgi:DNA-binding NarL/FixJ family response regulator
MKNSKYPTSTFNPAYPADVVCEFTVAGRSCRIVRNTSPDYTEAAIPKHSGTERVSTIANFTINGETYTVIELNSNEASEGADLATLLSGRELQIAALVAMGYPNKLVAYKLHISEWTVASYLRRIFSKLGVETRAAMAYRCAQLIWKFEGTYSFPEQKQRKSLV